MIEGKQAGVFRRLAARLFGPRRSTTARHNVSVELYHKIVDAARQPLFYAEWGVPDSSDGRREMIGLLAILVMRRLRTGGAAGSRLNQNLFDLMFADIDRNFREQGVGDLSVGKHVKRAASTFLARYESLDKALDEDDKKALGEVLQRNLFTSGGEPASQQLRHLVDYLSEVDRSLSSVPIDILIDGSADLNELRIPPDHQAFVGKIIDPFQ